jgi:acetylornithine deacetylase/succinyl-diaminopimelate desuccinylase-like protein
MLHNSAGDDTKQAFKYLEEHRDRLKQDLLDLAAIPSVSAIPEYSDSCLEAAQWLAKRMSAAGLEVWSSSVLPLERGHLSTSLTSIAAFLGS